MSEKPNRIGGFFASILLMVIFYALFTVASLLIAAVFDFLMKLPVISSILSLLIRLRGDPLSWTIEIVAAIISGLIVISLAGKMMKNQSTFAFACKCLGIILIILNVLFCIVNIMSGNKWAVNVIMVIAGYIFTKAD